MHQTMVPGALCLFQREADTECRWDLCPLFIQLFSQNRALCGFLWQGLSLPDQSPESTTPVAPWCLAPLPDQNLISESASPSSPDQNDDLHLLHSGAVPPVPSQTRNFRCGPLIKILHQPLPSSPPQILDSCEKQWRVTSPPQIM